MLSAKQSVIVQDCSQTRNNNELKKRQRSGRKQRKQTEKVNADTRFRAKNLSRPREKVSQAARESFTSRAKLDTSVLISHEDVSQAARKSDKIVQAIISSRETLNNFAREYRPVYRQQVISR